MPTCRFCGEEVEELFTCERCDRRFCSECGNVELGICNECADEEFEAQEDLAERQVDRGLARDITE